MNIDDFINSLSNTIDSHDEYLQHRADCISVMLSACVDVTTNFFPEKAKYLKPKLKNPGKDMVWNLRVIYELTSNLIHHYEENPNEPYLHRNLKPIMRSTGASAEEINEILALIPAEHHEESLKILQECDRQNDIFEDYNFEIHKALKKVVVDFFPQTFELPSRGLRELDSELFWLKDEVVEILYNWAGL